MPQTLEEFVRGTPFLEEVNRLREVERQARRFIERWSAPLYPRDLSAPGGMRRRADDTTEVVLDAVKALRIALRLPEAP
jgi:hypothetical protein